MKILTFPEFVKLPSGTLFMDYKPCVLGAISIKDDTLESGRDFWRQDITTNLDAFDSGEMFRLFDDSQHNGSSFDLDVEIAGRNAMYDDKQLFAVYEQKDLDQLIKALQKCKGV